MSENEEKIIKDIKGIDINHIGVFVSALENLVLNDGIPLERIAEVLEVDVQTIQKELVVHLFKSGYDAAKISELLKVEIDAVQQEIKNEGFQVADSSVLNTYNHRRAEMDIIRSKYFHRYFSLNIDYEKYRVNAYRKVNATIETITGLVKELSSAQFSEQNSAEMGKKIERIGRNIEGIQTSRILLDDCWRFLELLQEVRTSIPEDFMQNKINSSEAIIIKHVLAEVGLSINQVRRLEELEKIYQQISDKKVNSQKFNDLVVAIGIKIEAVKENNKASEIVYLISPGMHNAICGLLDGSVEIDEIRAIINYNDPEKDETENMMRILAERSDIYKINPEMYPEFRRRFGELVDEDEQKVHLFERMIIENLCQRRQCNEARKLIEKMIQLDNIPEDKKIDFINELQAIVLYREIGDLVLKQIYNRVSEQQDREFLEVLKKRLPKGDDAKSFMQNVSLGKDQFGIETITLGQIMQLEAEKDVSKDSKTKTPESQKPKDHAEVPKAKKAPEVKTDSKVKSNPPVATTVRIKKGEKVAQPTAHKKEIKTGIEPNAPGKQTGIAQEEKRIPTKTTNKKTGVKVIVTAVPPRSLVKRPAANKVPSATSVKTGTRGSEIFQKENGEEESSFAKVKRVKIAGVHQYHSTSRYKATKKKAELQQTSEEKGTKKPQAKAASSTIIEKKSTMQRIRENYYRMYEKFGFDDSQYKPTKYIDNPILVTEVLVGITKSYSEYHNVDDLDKKEEIVQEILKQAELIQDCRIPLDNCADLYKLLLNLGTSFSKQVNKNLDAVKKRISSRIMYEAIQGISLLDSAPILEETVKKYGNLGEIIELEELSKISETLARKIPEARRSSYAYRYTHVISENTDRALKGFLDGTISVEEIRKLLAPQGKNDELRQMLNIFTKILSDRSDIYPIDSEHITELIDRYVELFNGDNSKRLTFMNLASCNLCKQGKYNEANEAIDKSKYRREILYDKNHNRIGCRDLTDEEQAFNRAVNGLKNNIVLAIEVSNILLDMVNHPIPENEADRKKADEMENIVYEQLKEEVMTESNLPLAKAIDFWNDIYLGKDKLGVSKLTIRQLSEYDRIR